MMRFAKMITLIAALKGGTKLDLVIEVLAEYKAKIMMGIEV